MISPTKVLLVQAAARQRDLDHSHPLGIMSLASFLKQHQGYEVRLADMQLNKGAVEPILATARDFRPEVIGISAMTVDFPCAVDVARRLKMIFSTTPIVVGGAHTTHRPEVIAEASAIDYGFAGESETGFVALLEALADNKKLNEVPNLIYRRDGGLQCNSPAAFITDLDSLPFPAYDLIDVEAYNKLSPPGFIYRHRRYASLMTSRGCPFGCAYCHNVHGRVYRYRSAENIVQEMEELIAAYRVGEFVILDDLFNLLPDRVLRLAELILEKKWRIALNLPTGLRADLMTEEGLRLLHRAGMYRCLFAIDTTSKRIQAMTNRKIDVDKALRMIRLANDLGIMVHGTFIIGFPTETEEEARGTIATALQAGLHTAAFHRAIPFHGTALYRLAQEAGANLSATEGDFDFNKDSAAVNASMMTNDALIRLRRNAYRRFYLSFRRMRSLLAVLPNKHRLLPRLFLLWVRKALTG